MEQIHLYFCKSIFSDRFEHVTSKRSTDDTPAFWIFELLLQNDYKAETKGDEAENHPLSCNKDTKYGTEYYVQWLCTFFRFLYQPLGLQKYFMNT